MTVRYFAFGSNMSRARLEGRVGPVEDLGRAVLPDHCHRFNKLGRDGTGKGNIQPTPGDSVHGVLYELSESQWTHLAEFEGGYRSLDIQVLAPDGTNIPARTFTAVNPGPHIPPSPEYLTHYRTGLTEHNIDETYLRSVLSASD